MIHQFNRLSLFGLLAIYVCGFSSSVWAYGSSGHARQQETLILRLLIQQNLKEEATQLDLPELPFVVYAAETLPLAQQLEVLAAEKVLTQEAMSFQQVEVQEDTQVQRFVAAQRYDWSDTHQASVHWGEADLMAIESIESSATNRQLSVRFSWQVTHLAEWVWAPAFDQHPLLQPIKAAGDRPLMGAAQFGWRNNHWQLLALQLIATPHESMIESPQF